MLAAGKLEKTAHVVHFFGEQGMLICHRTMLRRWPGPRDMLTTSNDCPAWKLAGIFPAVASSDDSCLIGRNHAPVSETP
jgi:hypothetical protein